MQKLEDHFKVQEKMLINQIESLTQYSQEQKNNLQKQKDLLNSLLSKMSQTFNLTAISILLEAYSKRIDWNYAEKSKNRIY